jgi:hypothetical protein
MFVQVVQRAQVGEIFSGRGRMASLRQFSIEHPRELPTIDPLSLAAIWFRDPEGNTDLPTILVTSDGQERDWLAWFVTFAPTIRPFTALCRVLGRSDFTEHFDTMQPADLGKFENACLGLIFGEVLSSEDGLAKTKDPLTASACASVLSYALVRRLAIRKRVLFDEGNLPERWTLVRKITRQRERELVIPEVVRVSEILGSLLRKDSPSNSSNRILMACHELAEGGELISSASAFGTDFEQLANSMQGTREERVELFERVLEKSITSESSTEESFTLGYLASRIFPGTLTHAPLLAPARQNHPSAMLWYGVCAGLSSECNLFAEFGGVGRRVLRDLLALDDFQTRPRADIASSELEILLSGERPDDFPVTSPSQLSIELEPGISTVVNWSSRARARRSPEFTASRPDDSAWVEQELGITISKLIDLQRRLRTGGSRDIGYEQGSLYESRPVRRGPKQR